MSRVLKKTLSVVLLVLLALAIWGLIEPRVILDEKTEEASIPGLPAQWEEERIAVLADFQIGIWLANEGMVERALERVREERPAALLIAGDFIYSPTDEKKKPEATEELKEEALEIKAQIDRTVALLRPVLEAGIPIYAVLGNHDYLKEQPQSVGAPQVAEALAKALRAAGVTVLHNEAVTMKRDGGEMYLGGIGSKYAGEARPDEVVAAIPDGAPRIVLMHNPDTFEQLPPDTAPLAIAGHTHGGQVRVPGVPAWSWMALKSQDEITADGWIDGYGAPGNRLYVNRGIGFSVAPIRIACPPELTWFVLNAPSEGR
jgi:predicted MPP superfamily phosphohydrolase